MTWTHKVNKKIKVLLKNNLNVYRKCGNLRKHNFSAISLETKLNINGKWKRLIEIEQN